MSVLFALLNGLVGVFSDISAEGFIAGEGFGLAEVGVILAAGAAGVAGTAVGANKARKSVIRKMQEWPRYVNAWFESEESVPPLKIKNWYTLKFDIGPKKEQQGVFSDRLASLNFRDKEKLDLLLSLYSEDFRIEKHHHHIVLPRIGSSDTGQTRLQPLSSGSCRIELVVSLAKELELLQIIEVNVEVADEPAPVLGVR